MLPSRFWDKVQITDDCWVWMAHLNSRGYGIYRIGKESFAHRVIYKEVCGTIPDGYDIDHLCRNRACVRPDHLEAVTRSIHNSRTHRSDKCRKGHDLTEDNTYTSESDRQHRCRVCTRNRMRVYMRRYRKSHTTSTKSKSD